MSLIPEKPLLVSPSLAATLGLEEAVLLNVLGEVVTHAQRYQPSNQWHDISMQQLIELLPFWGAADLQRIATSLKDKGVLQINSAPITESRQLSFSLEFVNRKTTQTTAPVPSSAQSKQLITSHWQPCEDTVRQLSQYNIPLAFIEQQIPEFVTYWSERGEPQYSWGSKFIKRVLHAWRDKESAQASETFITHGWQPAPDTIDFLEQRSNIPRDFIQDCIPEFIIYWDNRKPLHANDWNSKFVEHTRRQWAKCTEELKGNPMPRLMPGNWQPDSAAFDVLSMSNIERSFAHKLVPEFVLYWRDRGEARSSWNKTFIQHAKFEWAKLHGLADEKYKRPDNSNRSRSRSAVEQLTDHSWAN